MKQPEMAAKSIPALKSTAAPGSKTPPDAAGEAAYATRAGQAATAFKGIEIDFDRAGFEGRELEFIGQAVRGGHRRTRSANVNGAMRSRKPTAAGFVWSSNGRTAN